MAVRRTSIRASDAGLASLASPIAVAVSTLAASPVSLLGRAHLRAARAARGYAPQHIGGIADRAQPGDRSSWLIGAGWVMLGASRPVEDARRNRIFCDPAGGCASGEAKGGALAQARHQRDPFGRAPWPGAHARRRPVPAPGLASLA